MYLEQYFVDGLGCASYLVGCEGAGIAAVIDPDRDIEKYLDTADGRGLQITHIIETHLHADHVSGNTELAERTGADIYVHESAGTEFETQPLKEGDALKLGNVVITVRHTPGHTPESITLLITDKTRADEPWMALTGDTLFVGDIGRPDLVGIEAARDLAGQMHNTLQTEILPLSDSVMVYPGHGAGSLCGKSIGAVRSTTIGFERRFNPALAPRELNEFIDFAVNDLPEQPGNHTRIKQMNRRGPRPLGDVTPRPISIQESIRHFQQGAAMLDLRDKKEFKALHVPGSVHMEPDDQLSNRIGFVLPPDMPIILLLADPSDYRPVVYSLARVGYDSVVGYLAEGLDVWEAYGLPLTSGDIVDIDAAELDKLLKSGNGSVPVVVDVREPWEYAQGHVPGAQLLPLGQLGNGIGEFDPQTPVAVICATGSRSQSAAALFGQQGFQTVYNVVGGTMRWMQKGLPLER